jgi:poly-gamma-glutamate synthesis protein (capsule biosynthesis protein)
MQRGLASPGSPGGLRIFLCGDVMLGRGIDQILPSPCPPGLHEGYVRSALDYVRLAEAVNGPIQRPVDAAYVWGAALDELRRARPDARIINLETSVTRNDEPWPKGINYRMSPENAACLTAAGIDCCVLGNNHVLDWGRPGLLETLRTLDRLAIKSSGAGRDLASARAPAVLELRGANRLLVYSVASVCSGTPLDWAAEAHLPGVNVLGDLSSANAQRLSEQIAARRQPGDIVIVSIHWGPNWGYDVPDAQRRFAHDLIDRTGASVVHGHSSHHPKAMEIYRRRLILYGCGDFLNDYEGIAGYDAFRNDLSLMYLVDIDPGSGALAGLQMVPLRIRRFQLDRPSPADTAWLLDAMDREARRFGAGIEQAPGGRLRLRAGRTPRRRRTDGAKPGEPARTR